MRQRGELFGLFRAEILHRSVRFEERDHVVDRADVFLQLRQQGSRRAFLLRGTDGVQPFLRDVFEVLAAGRRDDQRLDGLDEFSLVHCSLLVVGVGKKVLLKL